MPYYGHTKIEDVKTKKVLPREQWQLLKDHLNEVARLTEERAAKFRAGKLGRILGLTHDLGKYSEAFQKRLCGASEKVDHKTAGSQEVYRRFGKTSLVRQWRLRLLDIMAVCRMEIEGDPKNLPERLEKRDIPAYKSFEQEIGIPRIGERRHRRYAKG